MQGTYVRGDTRRLSRDLRDLQRHMSAAAAQARIGSAARAPANPADWKLLDELTESETWTVVKLAKRLEVNHSTVSRQIGVLQDIGLVTISTLDNDRRHRVVQLTAAGKQVVMDLREVRVKVLNHILAQWSDHDAQMLCRLFARFVKDSQSLTPTFKDIVASTRGWC